MGIMQPNGKQRSNRAHTVGGPDTETSVVLSDVAIARQNKIAP